MKNVSVALNVLLLGAVGYLYYYNFSGKSSGKSDSKKGSDNYSKDSACKRAHIAYVDLDSLNEHTTYIKMKRQELEAEQKRIENDWQSGYKNLEAKKNTFVKNNPSPTPDQINQIQSSLMQEQQQIDNTKQTLSQKLSEKSYAFMDDIQKSLKEFLTEYNKEKKYMYILTTGTGLDYLVYKDPALNITSDVIKGMNAKMKATPQ